VRTADRVQSLAVGILVVCAVVVTGLVVRRELVSVPARAAARPVENTIDSKTHAALMAQGHLRGSKEARLTIIEFVDLEYPFCAMVDGVLDSVLRTFAEPVALLIKHFPLQTLHRHAYNAALASECAAVQGKFDAFVQAVYATQDSLGILDWTDFARRAGVSRMHEFSNCLSGATFAERIRDDIAAGASAGVYGTPTYIVGNSVYLGDPAHPRFSELIMRALADVD